MTTHLTARLAWHMDGWNGHVCRNPSSNRYCIGPHSYPGEKIKDGRNLDWEEANAGKPCASLNQMPPCIHTMNAFGGSNLTAFDDPPSFFKTGSRAQWALPAATVCVWSYDAMYSEEARPGNRYDNFKRLELVKQYFQPIENEKSLVVHYANYSNPFSEEEHNKYVIVGLARVKKLGNIVHYPDTDEETKQQFGGAYVWQMNVETLYPDQGMRIPYHKYLDDPEVLEKILFVPENPRNFKYGTRHLTDDEVLAIVERFIEIANFLKTKGDTSENWDVRLTWLNSLVAELWQERGLYPGLARVLDLMKMPEAIDALRNAALVGTVPAFKEDLFDWLDEETQIFPGTLLPKERVTKVRREWKLRTETERKLMRDVLPRFDLPKEQLEDILSEFRAANGLNVDLSEIAENPYLLCERYVGNDPDDVIPFSRIDHGVFPSPDLGGDFLFELSSAERLRALCVDRLKYETKHVFITTGQMLQDVNKRLANMPEWKRVQFSDQYLQVDRETLEGSIVFRNEGERGYAYLRHVYEAEREIEDTIRKLANRNEIKFKSPVTVSHWRDALYDPKSKLVEKSASEYEAAIVNQAEICAQVFNKPISVLCGSAGTGKTTIIDAILKAIDKAHGSTASFMLLAPTGKAADRIRSKTGKPAKTVHSFLAGLGWLNDNLTLKTIGGKREEETTTFVIDEASMLDLELTATLFRAIKWNNVQRLILVGDPNQLPPIGRGRIFADIIDWLREGQPECVGRLDVNLRQMENRVTGQGTGILDLASIYVRTDEDPEAEEERALDAEVMFKKLQDLPEDGKVDNDLRAVYWDDADDLMEKLLNRIIADMETDTGQTYDEEKRHALWLAASKGESGGYRPDYNQVITPYRHEDFGTEAINLEIQEEARGGALRRIGHLSGITLFDKVLQFRNRGASDAIWAYNNDTGKNEQAQVFNGELGFVVPHGMDGKKWRGQFFRLSRFQVRFAGKENLAVGYGGKLGVVVNDKGKKKFLPNESAEDNLELAYAISVHKAQGSEFDRVYFVVPKDKTALLSPELFYTGVTRATKHCTLLIQQDIAPLIKMRRPESSHLVGINSSLFSFKPIPDGFELIRREGFMEEGRIHRALADVMVRSKSEVIVANLLFEHDVSFFYEKPLYARDGSFYLPDFTINWQGEEFYWEHLGLLNQERYRQHWEIKKAWYEEHFPGRLVITEEGSNLSHDAAKIIEEHFS